MCPPCLPFGGELILTTFSTSSKYFDPSLLNLSAAMTGQSVVKHFLTEGDKFLVSRLSPLADQGGYAVASNYGRYTISKFWRTTTSG